MEGIVDRIEELCKNNGISMRKLCKELDLSTGTIPKWRICSPSVDTVNKIATFFGVSMDYIVNGQNIKMQWATNWSKKLKDDILVRLEDYGYKPGMYPEKYTRLNYVYGVIKLRLSYKYNGKIEFRKNISKIVYEEAIVILDDVLPGQKKNGGKKDVRVDSSNEETADL